MSGRLYTRPDQGVVKGCGRLWEISRAAGTRGAWVLTPSQLGGWWSCGRRQPHTALAVSTRSLPGSAAAPRGGSSWRGGRYPDEPRNRCRSTGGHHCPPAGPIRHCFCASRQQRRAGGVQRPPRHSTARRAACCLHILTPRTSRRACTQRDMARMSRHAHARLGTPGPSSDLCGVAAGSLTGSRHDAAWSHCKPSAASP